MHALDIKNLVKIYGEHRAIDDVSFSIKKGEFFGLLGPNGAGKSTTIHCATGIAKISSGSIRVYGKDVEKEYREARGHVGLSPQEFNSEIFLTVYKILWYIGGYYGIARDVRRRRIDDLLKRLGLEEHKDKVFQALSGGLKRRVMLARALVHDPEMLILDEPTAGVDVEYRHELWQYLKDLNEQGKTILLTSHYLEEVEMLCERIAIINNGKLIEIGDKAQFVEGGRTLEKRYLELTKK